MAQTARVILGLLDRRTLKALVADRNRPQKHVERVCIVLAAAARGPDAARPIDIVGLCRDLPAQAVVLPIGEAFPSLTGCPRSPYEAKH